jgi:hypothetical protein
VTNEDIIEIVSQTPTFQEGSAEVSGVTAFARLIEAKVRLECAVIATTYTENYSTGIGLDIARLIFSGYENHADDGATKDQL